MLISTKLLPPLMRNKMVNRQHMRFRTKDLVDHRLSLIVAPAGFGKTCLMSEWRKCLIIDGHKTGWLSLDGTEQDPATLLAYLVNCLNPAQGTSLPLSTAANGAMGLSTFINNADKISGEFVLFLDNVERLGNCKALHTLNRILQQAPANLHLVMSSRVPPALDLQSLRQSGFLLELDQADLQFSLHDTAEFFRLSGQSKLRLADVDAIYARTGGWPAGLQLTVSAAGKSKACIDKYFDETIWQHLDSAEQKLLAALSVVEWFLPELSRVLGEDESVPDRLESLRQQTPIVLDHDSGKNRSTINPMFRDLFKVKATEYGHRQVHDWHKKACDWYDGNGYIKRAFEHAVITEQYERAVDMLDKTCRDLIFYGEFQLLNTWLDSLPQELIHERLSLCLDLVWFYTLSMQLSEAQSLFGHIEKHVTDGQHVRMEYERELVALRALIAVHNEDCEATIAHAQTYLQKWATKDVWITGSVCNLLAYAYVQLGAYDKVQEAEIPVKYWPKEARSPFTEQYAVSLRGRIHDIQGNWDVATQIYSDMMSAADNAIGARSQPAAINAALLANLQYWRNQTALTRELLAGRTDFILHSHGFISAEAIPALVRARIHAGDVERAFSLLGRFEATAMASNQARFLAISYDLRLWYALTQNRIKEAKSLYQKLVALMPEHNEITLDKTVRAWCLLAMLRYNLVLGSSRTTLENAGNLLACEARVGFVFDMQARLLAAAAYHKHGQSQRLSEEIADIIMRIRETGAVRIILNDLDLLRPLLGDVKTRLGDEADPHGLASYLDEILSTANATPPLSLSTVNGTAIPDIPRLTPREKQVLGTVAQGLTNREVANILSMSPETIKWYLKQIGAKLHARNRTQCVLIAIHHGLIENPYSNWAGTTQP